MRFKLDENMPDEAADFLRQLGHDVATVYEQGLVGKEDEIIGDVCKDEGRALITTDMDFSNVIDFPPTNYPGLIILRLASQGVSRILRLLQSISDAVAKESVQGCLWIVEESRIRVRRSDSV